MKKVLKAPTNPPNSTANVLIVHQNTPEALKTAEFGVITSQIQTANLSSPLIFLLVSGEYLLELLTIKVLSEPKQE